MWYFNGGRYTFVDQACLLLLQQQAVESCNVENNLHITRLRRSTLDIINREFKITTTATATRTSLNKRFNEQNNGSARALYLFVNFFAVLCKATTWNDQFCVVWRTWTTTAIFLKFYFKCVTVFQIQFRDSFDSDKQSKWLKSIPRFVGEM